MNDNFVKWIYNGVADTKKDLLDEFYIAPIWDGKTFWEVETEMEWVEW